MIFVTIFEKVYGAILLHVAGTTLRRLGSEADVAETRAVILVQPASSVDVDVKDKTDADADADADADTKRHGTGGTSRNAGSVPADDEKKTDVVQSAMGLLGRWQIVICIWISLLKVPVAFYQLSIVLLAPPAEFRCRDAGAPHDAQCRLPSGDKCQRFEYDRSVFTETIITEWDLVCEREQLANVVQTTFMFGVLVGNVVFGMAADRFGRKLPLVVAIVVQLVTGVLTAFSPWFELFLVVRFLSAMAVGGTMITSFVICMEIVGGKWRTIIAVLYHIPFSIGHSLLGVIGYFFRDWHHFQLVISLPTIVLLAYWWTVPESPRWLLAVGKEEEAIELLETAAKKNKLGITDMKAHLSTVLNQNTKGGNEQRANIIDLFRTPNMRKKTLCVFFNWMTCGLCFFGLAQYMGHGAGGNIFVNIVLSGLMELPAGIISIYCMNKFGRRNTLMGAQMFAAIACLLIMTVPPDDESLQWLRVSFASAGIVGMSVSFTTIYLFTGELFPTVVRNAGVGSSSMCARLGSMVAPFITSLGSISFYLPPLFFGLSPLIGSLLCLYLPETAGYELPESLEDGENFGTKKAKTAEGAANLGYTNDEVAA